MDEVERQVVEATKRFYAAIEKMVSGEGLEEMERAWHHSEKATIRHPIDNWSVGWDQIWATWQFTATFGRADRAGSTVLEIKPYVFGDVAYATVVFVASPAWGGEKMMCTNVLLKKDGEWKIIHHHADPSPGMQVALEKMLAEQ
jgi:ketosteroid isomerase-like protein